MVEVRVGPGDLARRAVTLVEPDILRLSAVKTEHEATSSPPWVGQAKSE